MFCQIVFTGGQGRNSFLLCMVRKQALVYKQVGTPTSCLRPLSTVVSQGFSRYVFSLQLTIVRDDDIFHHGMHQFSSFDLKRANYSVSLSFSKDLFSPHVFPIPNYASSRPSCVSSFTAVSD